MAQQNGQNVMRRYVDHGRRALSIVLLSDGDIEQAGLDKPRVCPDTSSYTGANPLYRRRVVSKVSLAS